MRLQLAIPLRWGDLDAYNHVNNVEVMRILEEARVRAFWRFDTLSDASRSDEPGAEKNDASAPPNGSPLAVMGGGPESATATLIARHEVDYLAPISYGFDPLTVDLWIGGIGGASFEVCYEVSAPDPTHRGRLLPVVRASSTIVLLDTVTQRPRRVSDQERAAWSTYVEEPVVLRGRRTPK